MKPQRSPRRTLPALLAVTVLLVSQTSPAQVYWTKAPEFTPPTTGHSPDLADLDGDGDLDLVYAVVTQSYRNVGSPTEPAWLRDDSLVAGVDYENCMTVCFADLDADGDLDLSVGYLWGDVFPLIYYRNIGGSAQPIWQLDYSMYNGLPIGSYSCPELADLDSDGDLDLLLATSYHIRGFRNTGTPEAAAWSQDSRLVEGVTPPTISDPSCGDLDGDGDLDLVVGGRDEYGPTMCFENTGTPQGPVWAQNDDLLSGVDTDVVGSGLDVADIDGDGDPDLLSRDSVVGRMMYLNQGPTTPVEQSSWGRIKALFASQ